jgi:uncharacterized protein YecT (DUF1311 family)
MPLDQAALAATLSLAALWVVPVAAASFDCTKAQSPLEHATCTKPDLSKADDILARAYASALGGLSEGGGTALRNSEKAWLVYVDRLCTGWSVARPKVYSDDEGRCLTMEFQDRERLLEQSRMVGGLRFTFVDHYRAKVDADLPNIDPQGREVATTHSFYAQIDDTGDEAMKFNAIVAAGLHSDIASDPTDGEDTFGELQVSTVDPTRITLTDTVSEFNHGAPHGYYQVYYVHYLRHEQRLLKAADVFGGSDWQDRLRKLVVDSLNVSLGDDEPEADPSQTPIHEDVVDPSDWDFRAQGLLVQFAKGEVASPVEGAISVIIPWALIEDDLTPGIGMDLRTGFEGPPPAFGEGEQ